MFDIQPTLSTAAISTLLSAALERAAELEIKVSVAVVDASGALIALTRMQGALLGGAELAIDKAWTSAAFGRDTGGTAQRLAGLPEAVREGILRRPRFTDLSGGLPIRVAGVLVGGVGVSGGPGRNDEMCAEAALAKIGADPASSPATP